MICAVIPACERLLRFLHCQEEPPVLSVHSDPHITGKRRRNSHIFHHVIGKIILEVTVVLIGGIQGQLIQPVICTAVLKVVKFQLQAVPLQPELLHEPQRIVPFRAQPDRGKHLPINFHVAFGIFFFRSILKESFPVLDPDIHCVHPAVVKNPRGILRILIGRPDPELLAVHEPGCQNTCKQDHRNADFIYVSVLQHLPLPP